MTIRISSRTLDPAIAEKIREISGENISICMQCGTCGAVCPMFEQAGAPPRQMVQLAQLGLLDELMARKSHEVCAACHHCQVRCPRGLDLPKVMEALRLIRLRENEDYVTIADIPAEDIDEMPQMALVAAFRKLTA